MSEHEHVMMPLTDFTDFCQCGHVESRSPRVDPDAIAAAASAIVDAADKQESAFEGDKSDADYANACRVTEERVRAWRKLKGM